MGKRGELYQEVIAEFRRAKKKRLKTVGAKMRSEIRKKMRRLGAKKRRLQAIRAVVGKDGTLVILDHAPLAWVQEFGGTYESSTPMLVPFSGERLRAEDKTGLFPIKNNAGDTIVMRRVEHATPQQIAAYKTHRRSGGRDARITAVPVGVFKHRLTYGSGELVVSTVLEHIEEARAALEAELFSAPLPESPQKKKEI